MKFIANISQYTEEAFRSEMIESTIPEIQRQNLESVILTLKALGLNDLIGFDFLDPPPVSSMLEAMSSLYALSALDESGLLTVLGRRLAAMPMAPSLAKVLVASVDLGCSRRDAFTRCDA